MGATIHLHYCMNKFVGWSLLHSENEKCGKCGMTEKKGGCCKDEHKTIQLKTEHQKTTVAQFIFPTPDQIVPPTNYMDNDVASFQSIAIHFPVCHAPPDIGKQKLFVLYRVFRI